MAAELVIQSEVPSAMPGVLMLLLGLAVSSLASYVALDLARRVRVLRTRTGALWLLGAAAALSLGIWSCQIIGTAAEPLAFPIGYDGPASLLAWAVALAVGLAGFGAVSGTIATPRPGRARRLRARRRHGRCARRLAQLARPAAGHQLAGSAAGRGDLRRLRRLHDGARCVLSRRATAASRRRCRGR
jgi:hypothetical protein